MAHAILQGSVSSRMVHEGFRASVHREGGLLVRFLESFLASDGRSLLLETVVVEGGRSRRFYIDVHDREGGVGIRAAPLTDPEKTDGVKRAVALVVGQVLAAGSEVRVVSHHLEGYLQE